MGAFRRWSTGAVVGACVMPVAFSSRAAGPPAVEGAAWLGVGIATGLTNPLGAHSVSPFGLAGVSLGLRFDEIVIGGSADAAGTSVDSETFLAGHAGWSRIGDTRRFSILAEVGRHSFSDLGGGGLLQDVTSKPVSLPFLGLRLVGDEYRQARGSFLLGWWVVFRRDLGTTTAEATGSCFGGCDDLVGTWRVGGNNVAVGLHIGFDVGGVRPAAPGPH